MGQSHGFNNTVVIAKETTYATAPTTGFKWAGIVESFEPEESNNVDSRMSLGYRAPLMLRHGAKEVDGSMSVALQNARLIAYALGNVTSVPAGAVHTHTITSINAAQTLPSFTVQNHNAEHAFTRNYIGGKIDTLTITASAEEAVMIETDMLFSHVVDTGITPAAVVAELDNYFMFYEGTVKINTVAQADVTEFELEIGNNLERRFTLNGVNRPTRIEEGNLELTSSITMDFTSTANWTAFKNGDAISVELNLVDVGNANHSIKITVSGGLYDTNAISASAEDLQEQELEAIFTSITVTAVDANATLL